MELLLSDQPSTQRDAVGWLSELADGLRTVGSAVPEGFEGYARVLHPAQIGSRTATWAEIAAWSGRRLSPDSDSQQLMVRDDRAPWNEQPGHGCPEEGPAGPGEAGLRRLYELLAEATDTPDHLWLLIDVVEYDLQMTASGYTPAWEDRRTPSRTGERRLRLQKELEQRCGVSVAGDRFILHRGAFAATGGRWMQFPSYWWPQDRSWLVYTHIDCTSTYVAGDHRLVERLLDDDLLEVVEAQLDHPFDGRT
jgi:hypothetical protein